MINQKIQGLMPEDLCEKGLDCENQQNCGKHHPDWNFLYCALFLQDKEHDSSSCEALHITWDQIS